MDGIGSDVGAVSVAAVKGSSATLATLGKSGAFGEYLV